MITASNNSNADPVNKLKLVNLRKAAETQPQDARAEPELRQCMNQTGLQRTENNTAGRIGGNACRPRAKRPGRVGAGPGSSQNPCGRCGGPRQLSAFGTNNGTGPQTPREYQHYMGKLGYGERYRKLHYLYDDACNVICHDNTILDYNNKNILNNNIASDNNITRNRGYWTADASRFKAAIFIL
jgi:hypothetical protein